MGIFWDNVRAMRAWMKDKGYQDRPLVISDYGILWPAWYAPQFTPLRVSQFMTRTFDSFLSGTDPDLGYPADDYRLVQAWAWYSLSDDQQYNGYLFHSSSQSLSLMGETYAAYTGALSDTLYRDLSARLVAHPAPSLTISLTANVGNLGKLPATGVRTQLKIVSAQGLTVFSQDEVHDAPPRFDGVVALSTLSQPWLNCQTAIGDTSPSTPTNP